MSYVGQALVIVALSTSVIAAMGGELVTDESTRIEVLKAAFPNAVTSVSQDKPLDWKPDPWPEHNLTDALHGEREYTVTGTLDHFELAWVNIYGEGGTPDPNPVRRLRMKVYAIGSKDRKTYVALAQYDIFFTHKLWKRLRSDWAFARLFLVTRQAEGWRVDHTSDSLIQGGRAIQSFRVFDINGDGQDEIMIEAEGSTAHRKWITMTISGITNGRLHRLAEVETRSTTVNSGDTEFMAVLNIERSRKAKGKAFYFTKTVYQGETGRLAKPRFEEEVVDPMSDEPIPPLNEADDRREADEGETQGLDDSVNDGSDRM